MLHPVIIASEPRPLDPPDLLARLAARGVRLVDGRCYLLLDLPPELLAAPEWPELEAAASRCGATLQNLAVLVATSRADTTPRQLVERILELPAGCFPVLIQALGGLDRLELVAENVTSEPQLDLCFAAYLQALGYQVAHGLGEDEDEDEDEDGDQEGTPAVPPGAVGSDLSSAAGWV